MIKEGGVSGAISFASESKWCKKRWGINLNEWLEKDKQSFVGDQNFSQLPVNKKCADKWLKDRNDPQFWGLEVKERVLCGDCLTKLAEKMSSLRKAEFNRYRKVGRL